MTQQEDVQPLEDTTTDAAQLEPSETDPFEQTSLKWDGLEHFFSRLDAKVNHFSGGWARPSGLLAGCIGLIVSGIICYTLLLTPLHKVPFGSPYVYTSKTAQHFVPKSRLGRAKLVKRRGLSGAVKYTVSTIGLYVAGYLVPYFFSTKLSQPDLLMLILRSIFVSFLVLLSIRLLVAPIFPREEAQVDA